MKVLERQIQKINQDKWDELEANEEKWDALESQHGFPPKRRYRALSGTHDFDTLIVEREWDSMSAMEAAFEAAFQDPEYQKIMAASAGISRESSLELYSVL